MSTQELMELRTSAVGMPVDGILGLDSGSLDASRPDSMSMSVSIGPGHRVYRPVKFMFEWTLAALIALTTLPLVAALAVMIKSTSPGPALYRQRRVGMRGKVYWINKLRTMRQDSEAKTGPVWAAEDDERITPLGKFLRDTHLDELPQVWNVLMGQMSLIGPRPERPEIVAKLEEALPRYPERLEVRPGVTGLAQMNLPADTNLESVRRKLAHDLYYITHLSIVLDTRIGLCTAFYFSRAMADASCKLLVRKYKREIEREMAMASKN